MDSGDEDELTTGSRDFYKMREKLFKVQYASCIMLCAIHIYWVNIVSRYIGWYA